MIKVHLYKNSDQKAIDAMIAEIAREFEQPISSPKSPAPKIKIDRYWVAFHDNAVIGTVAILQIEQQAAILKSMFVKKTYRGDEIGLSSLLLKKAFDWCIQEGITSIYLGTMLQFKAAHKFYEKHGFYQLSLDQLPSNFIHNPLDTIFYKKTLVL